MMSTTAHKVVSPAAVTQPKPARGLLQRQCACGSAAGPTGECAGCRRGHGLSGMLQAKLRVSQPGDPFEREADRVAEQVMRVPEPVVQRQAATEPPRMPDLPRLTAQLSDDIGDNLYAYGHHFYRIATLYPDQPDLLEDAFARYALGKKVLETGFGFLGAEPGTASALALGTGITFKGVNLFANGELVIDYQFDLGKGLKLEAGIDLAVNPDDFSDVKKADASLSLVGRF